MSRPRRPPLSRKDAAVLALNEEAYDLICDLAELEGDAEECTAGRAEIWQYVYSLPRYCKRARDKVWRETV